MDRDPFDREDDELEAADDRIRRIREGGEGSPPPPAPTPAGDDYTFDDEPDMVSRARERARSTRSVLGGDVAPEPEPARAGRGVPADTAPVAPGDRARQAFLIVGGVVVLGLLVLVVVLLIGSLGSGGGPGPFSGPTPTMTPTPTPTLTPTPVATATPQAPNLSLPPLTCVFQSGAACLDYCQMPENAGECDSARSFIAAQDADPAVFFQCVAPGPGPNQGNPQDCLEEAWRANQ